MEKFEIGQRVEGGKGEDHDTGRIEQINGSSAYVSWDSGVKTWAPVDTLTAI